MKIENYPIDQIYSEPSYAKVPFDNNIRFVYVNNKNSFHYYVDKLETFDIHTKITRNYKQSQTIHADCVEIELYHKLFPDEVKLELETYFDNNMI